MKLRSTFCVAFFLGPVVLLGGCSTAGTVDDAVTGVTGFVTGAQKPVVGATIQLYSVGTGGDASNAQPLLAKAMTTDALGAFDITGKYACTNATEVYLVATGGQPMEGVTNANLALMTALGPCASLVAGTHIAVNELTTVAAVNALAAKMTAYTAVGSGSADVAALDAGFTLAAAYVSTVTGEAPGEGVPAGEIVPIDAIDTLGDIAAVCVESAGGVAGDGSVCGTLFSLTTLPGGVPPTDTVAALLNMAKDPSLQTGALYGTVGTDAPFGPGLLGPPASFQVGLIPSDGAGGLELGPTSVSFPATTVSRVSIGPNVMLMNQGTTATAITTIKVAGQDAAAFSETNDCPAMLAAGAYCSIRTMFAPWDEGSRSATVQVNGGQVSVGLSGTGAKSTWTGTLMGAQPSLYLDFNEKSTAFIDEVQGAAFTANGTITPEQPGFDATWPANMSAAFAPEAYLTANDTASGDFEWSQPFSLMLQIDNLQYAQSGTTYLLSKGDVGGAYGTPWYALTLVVDRGVPQLCFTVNGTNPTVAESQVRQSMCTRIGTTAIPNGYNYSILVTNDGTGSPQAYQIYLNGINSSSATQYSLNGFGSVVTSVGGTGKGYADSTVFTTSGGGANCTVAGTMTAVGGVPQSISYTHNYGCASLPALKLTNPMGTGVTLTPVLLGASISTAKSFPLVVGGAHMGGKVMGMGGTAATSSPQRIDELAAFPSVLSAGTIGTLFWETKFYQGLVNAVPATPRKVVFDNDGCVDPDNLFALELTLAAQKQGYISLEGVVDTDSNGESEAVYRQILNQAGLTGIPVSVPSLFTATSHGLCTAANVNAYDASAGTTTPQTTGAYEAAATMYRTILAANPKMAVTILLEGSFRGVADLMQSPADSISSLTGAQLLARNAANGGAIYAEGLGANVTFSADNLLQDWKAGQYVVTHNGSLPIYWFGGSPQVSGPGVLVTRPSVDPLTMAATAIGTDVRQAWDSMAVASLMSPVFSGGAAVQIGGAGSGYAETTPFLSSGGGTNCTVAGTMSSSGGVPNSVSPGLGYVNLDFTGIGWGCTSAPKIVLTAPTGNGAKLTAPPVGVCGTVTINGEKSGSTSTATCSNHYFLPYSMLADPSNPAVYQWFLNSLIDPPVE